MANPLFWVILLTVLLVVALLIGTAIGIDDWRMRHPAPRFKRLRALVRLWANWRGAIR